MPPQLGAGGSPRRFRNDKADCTTSASAAKSDIITTVTKIEAGVLPAESFEIPADYKVKTQK